MIFMLIIGLALAFCVAALAILPLKWRWYWKLAACLAVLAAACKMSLTRVLGGHYFAPDFPPFLIYAWGVLFAAVVVFALLLVAFELLRLLAVAGYALVRRRRLRLPRRLVGGCQLAMLAFSLAVAVWGLCGVLAFPRVVKVALASPTLPANLDGLRIVQLSDLHVDNCVRADRVAAIVEAVNRLRPDLVVITGDFFDGEVPDHGADLAPLAELEAPLGVYGSTGNHEYYYDFNAWMAFLESLNVKMLLNSHAVPTENLIVAGIEDKFPNLEAALADSGDGFRIILGHTPLKILRTGNFEAFSADLVLLGHTHGGAMPVLDKLVALANGGMVRGMYDFRGTATYVSPGTRCWSGFPIRVLNPAEITLFTLKRAAPKEEK